ncbi:MAG TPA: hypothetical protein VJ464_11310 [Blastocatellia bacterium]|nr:hypothetical protein [Blastocatellia bacterium]
MRQAVSGLFIAASGFNGNVASSYEELREHCDIEIVGGTDIKDFLKREYSVACLQQIARSIGAYMDRTTNSDE